MNANEPFGPSGLTLMPLDDEPQAAAAPVTGKSRFHANTRGGDDRRHGERREELRLSDDRRAGTDRRPRKGWERGKNL